MTTTITLTQWKRLYDLMAQVKQLAPWEFMEEGDVFAIQPRPEMIGLVSVMGMLGQHYAIGVYQGVEGLQGFAYNHRMGERLTPASLLQVPQLQGSWEDRALVAARDRAIIKQLDLKFRGPNAWPVFRRYHPGCPPWYLEQPQEADLLIAALEQTLEVAPRFRENPALFRPTDSGDSLFMRIRRGTQWVDEVFYPPMWQFNLELQMDVAALDVVKQLPVTNVVVEVDVFMMMETPVQEGKDQQPFFPFCLLMAEHQSQFILGFELCSPLPTLQAMWEEIPALIVRILAKYQIRPRQFLVRESENWGERVLPFIVQLIAQELGSSAKISRRLTAIDRAKRLTPKFQPQ